MIYTHTFILCPFSGSIKLSTTDFRRALAQLMGRKEADEKVALLSEKVW